MALQQVVDITFVLMGDGTTTTFKYAPSQMFALTTDGNSKLVSSSTAPTSCSAVSDFPGHITASILGGSPSKFQLVFGTAPANNKRGTVIVSLFFASE
jgi:hypothetical protein